MAGQSKPQGARSVNGSIYKVGNDLYIDIGGVNGFYKLNIGEDPKPPVINNNSFEYSLDFALTS